MSRRNSLSKLCSAINDSLSPYAELLPTSANTGDVKDLLIVLSQVCSQIKRLTVEIESGSDSDDVESDSYTDVTENSSRVVDCGIVPDSESENHCCLAKAITVLVSLLAVENQYVQHLVSSTLVAISDFIVASGNSSDEFLQLLLCLKSAIINSFPSPTGCNSEASVNSANWLKVAVIVQVLRRILKNLKQDADDHLFKLYLDSAYLIVSNVPWDLLDEVFFSQTSNASGDISVDSSLEYQPAISKSVIMFLGNLIQLLCSLVDKSILVEAGADDLDKHPLIGEINNILPRLLGWCIGNSQKPELECISKYHKHKLLILMIRLSYKIQLDRSVLLSWLLLVHLYFDDLLCLQLAEVESDQDKHLEGSPFFDAAKENISSRHLQRLAIFLFLRCSLSLVNMETSSQNSKCVNLNPRSAANLNLDIECCSQSKGLQELHRWLQLLSYDFFLDHEKCAESIASFQFSFLQLYMHEDDILFQLLLQLLGIPFYYEKRFDNEGTPCADVDVYSIVLDFFNPVHLFHVFLAKIHYDHQVLLDYLISKDTGACSAEYLLRCLRMVSNKWSLFMDFPWSGENEIQLHQKRRKVSSDHPNSKGIVHYRTERLPYECASNCLLELKTSIESLHHKNLFPYNPQVLLKRLSGFQELCRNQMCI